MQNILNKALSCHNKVYFSKLLVSNFFQVVCFYWQTFFWKANKDPYSTFYALLGFFRNLGVSKDWKTQTVWNLKGKSRLLTFSRSQLVFDDWNETTFSERHFPLNIKGLKGVLLRKFTFRAVCISCMAK